MSPGSPKNRGDLLRGRALCRRTARAAARCRPQSSAISTPPTRHASTTSSASLTLSTTAVFRGGDQTNPAAEMIVKMSYKKGVGKDYAILKQSGSSLIQKFGLLPLLDNEKAINNPATVAQSWFTSANYEMHLKPGVTQNIDGRPCLALSITPRHKAPNMIDGTLWVDAVNHTLVEVEGVASKSPSPFAGSTKMMRQYTLMQGYAMASHARAESSSMLFGRTVIVIDYSDYHFELRPTQ